MTRSYIFSPESKKDKFGNDMPVDIIDHDEPGKRFCTNCQEEVEFKVVSFDPESKTETWKCSNCRAEKEGT